MRNRTTRSTLTPLLAGVALLSIATPPLAATVVLRQNLEQLTHGSETVVHGQVVKTWTAWDPGRTAIWTHYEIQVAEAWKGVPGHSVVISEPGGELDGLRMAVPGAPQYHVGEQVVVFAVRTPVGYLRTCGWGQGRYLVSADGRVRPDLAQTPVVDRSKPGATAKSAAPAPTTVDELRRRVLSMASAEGGAQ